MIYKERGEKSFALNEVYNKMLQHKYREHIADFKEYCASKQAFGKP